MLVAGMPILWLTLVDPVLLSRKFTGTYVDTDAESLNLVLLRPHNDNRGFVEGDECQVLMCCIRTVMCAVSPSVGVSLIADLCSFTAWGARPSSCSSPALSETAMTTF